ncbi:unnamed protein product [Brassicogethes aeneus]|uniref:PHD-type domain-containing protein n=1 Tax=Brassicogethes aeneus TaxID=1431903 RepID=A0A9P0BF66_BRAAE|nr:unnamed protein product [Brassicogethes aeneus]
MSAAQYTRDHIKLSVGKILQTLGWHSINSTPLEVLTDVLARFLSQLTKLTNDYANEFGQTDANLDHLGLAFREMGISIGELEEYVTYVNFSPPPALVPKYPIPKENNLNFLKPGSKEVVTRPVHIHEHLPPMYPLLEGAENDVENVEVKKEAGEETTENGQVFKKPADVSPTEFKRSRREDEGSSRPTREISSVMMTTSGFLSPAREGKLPEAKAPIQTVIEPALPNPAPIIPAEVAELPMKKIPKVNNRKVDRKKDRIGKELFKPFVDEKVTRKSPNITKEKIKKIKNSNLVPSDMGMDKVIPVSSAKAAKINKTLADARMKTEKLNTTITPIPMKAEPVPAGTPLGIDKINTEPDRKKVNIFKKISNVKNEKHDIKSLKKEEARSRGGSPNLVIDEREELSSKNIPTLPGDVTIEPIPANSMKSPEKLDFFDDGSPPGTPSTPKTPEMISHSPPLVKEKRKRKEGKKVKKVQKQHDDQFMDLERPKTPEAEILRGLPFPFIPILGGIHSLWPGLIPNPMNNMNPLFPFPQLHNFGKNPLFPNPYGLPSMMNNPVPPPSNHPPAKIEEPVAKQPKLEPVAQAPPQEITEVISVDPNVDVKLEKKGKEHKKEKKDKIKKKNKKDKVKDKAEKKKLKEEKKVKEKIKKEKKEKKKDKEVREGESPVPKLFLKLGSQSPRPETPETTRKLNIKPIVKKDEEAVPEERATSPGLAKISALVTGPPKPKTTQPAPAPSLPSTDPIVPEESQNPVVPVPKVSPGPGRPRLNPLKPKTSPAKPKKRRSSVKKTDAQGNQVWICPACNKQDDGSPMIGCDGCDAWYHWVCVRIQVPPDENENWYCKHCLPKNNEDLGADKKKKRKKKEKKEH